jgi:DNA repair protein RadD
VCPGCGFEFPFEDKPKIAAQASEVPVMAADAIEEWRPVRSRRFDYHEGKMGKPPSVKVSYQVSLGTWVREWLCPQHSGFARQKADRWWSAHGGSTPFPRSVMEWLERQSELNETDQISVKPDGRYWTVAGHQAGAQAANDNTQAGDNDNAARPFSRELDDEVPF